MAENELLEGNAYVDASTFLDILIGTIAGAKMVLISGGISFVTVALLLIAFAGVLIIPSIDRFRFRGHLRGLVKLWLNPK